MIARELKYIIEQKLFKAKVIIVTGPRQTGKTTMIRQIAEEHQPYLFLDGDDPTVRELLSHPNTEQIREILGKNTLVFIDEAQRIPGIGLTLKIIADQFSHVQLLVTGSSSLEITRQMSEPLTGRKWEYLLFPVSWNEWEQFSGIVKATQSLESRLIYGMYPEILNYPGEEKERIKQLVNSYLYMDILSYANIKKPEVLEKLLQALAFQVGSEVSHNELSRLLNIDKNTVKNYIDLLEKCYVIFRLNAFSSNQRNEIRHNKKIYFYDNGIRNMLIGNFSPLTIRTDKGALWENFLISERKKFNEYNQSYAKSYFWRTVQQQEVDYIEEADGIISAYEIKWNPTDKFRPLVTFSKKYNTIPQIIHMENFRKFLNPEKTP